VRETSRRQWFSGTFRYYLPLDYDSRVAVDNLVSRVDKLFDLSLTPQTLWNLAPWSWAVDWFANVGDVLANAERFQSGNLVMRYGYLMEHTMIKDTWSLVEHNQFVSTTKWKDPPPVSGSFSLVSESKLRVKANPFGFGVKWEALSPFQLSIAAALGITRS